MEKPGLEKSNSKRLSACVYTFSKSQDNYGEVLQYLATQEFLYTQGIDAYLIRDKYNGLTKLQFVKGEIAHIVKLFWRKNRVANAKRKTNIQECKKHPRYFDEFRNCHFRIIEVCGVKKNPPHADLYIAGSDQIWNYPKYLPYLDWGDAVRMSFATSFGKLSPNNTRLIEKIKPLLLKIDVVTVREDIGLEICHKAGVYNAIRIMDPTLLLKENDYQKYECNIDLPDKYVFLYMIGNETYFDVNKVYDFAKSKELPVIYVASQGWQDDKPKFYPTINEWLTMMRNATYVITNSFHGVAFSIIYHKPFCSILLSGSDKRTNNRVETLLKYCHLVDRIYNGDMSYIDKIIDFKMNDSKLEENYKIAVEQINKAKTIINLQKEDI